MYVRPRADEEEIELEESAGVVLGTASQDFESVPLTREEIAAERRARRARLAKRRPAGFAPWPVDVEPKA